MKALALTLLVAAAVPAGAQSLWRYPEAADKNAIFLGGFAAALTLFAGSEQQTGFSVFLPEFFADYVLPVGLPFSLGAYFYTPEPNLKSFGLRAGYHFDLGDENLDLYLLYVFDLGFLRNDVLTRYGDEKQEIRYYDFRAGIRRRFGRFFCIGVETGFKLQSIRLGIAIALN